MVQVEMIAKFTEEVNRELEKCPNRVLTKAAGGRLMDFIGRMIVADLLLDSRAIYPGLGIFSVATRAERSCINPQTGASIGKKPAYKIVKFKAYRHIREQIN